jgi:riboflavin kinase/FMN adenylyltransferase
MLKTLDKNGQINGTPDYKIRRGVGLGVFDGFHLGHKELIQTLASRSSQLGITSCVYTFTTHPAQTLNNSKRISKGLITTESDRIDKLKDSGIDEIILCEFSVQFSEMSPEEFLDDHLSGKLNAALIVVGFNFKFGKNRAGDIDMLKDWAYRNNVEVIVVEPVLYNGQSISSSAIRDKIKEAKITEVNAMLGRKYSIKGEVKSGQKLGRTLGFPTANTGLDAELCFPQNGVYFTKTLIDNKVYESITNIGIRPSVSGVLTDPIAETLILDTDIYLYGKSIEVFFLEYLREEKKFNSIEALSNQINADVDKARLYHAEAEECFLIARNGNVNLYGIKSVRFSTSVLEVIMRMPLSAELASTNTLLARVLTATCKRFPTRPEVSRYLDSQYGTQLDFHVETQGDLHVIMFTIDALRTFGDDKTPFMNSVRVLFDMFNDPDVDSDFLFDREIIESEKQSIISEIAARDNDKQKYAMDRCIELYAPDCVQSIRSYGESKIIEAVTPEMLRDAYKELIQKSDISIYLAGNYTSNTIEELCSLISGTFDKNIPSVKMIPGKTPEYFNPQNDFAELTEQMDVEQSKICIAYKNSIAYFSHKTIAFNVFNTMLGADVNSLLFQKVREEMGLAYSVFSMSLRYLGGVVLSAGVAHENIEIAESAMKEQVVKVANGEFTKEMFDSAVISCAYSYRCIPDNLHSIIRYYANSNIRGLDLSVNDSMHYLGSITREDVMDIARKLELQTVFRLTCKNCEN